jgi:serine protease Do
VEFEDVETTMAVMIEQLTQVSQLADELAELAALVQSSVVMVRGSRNGGGSGVVWNDRGLVITNQHVAPGQQAEVSWGRGDGLVARVIASSPNLDIAALQIEGESARDPRLVPARIRDSSTLRIGELVVAVGNPLGERNAVTLGVVSAAGTLHSRWGEREVIQAAITLRPGNSGGALADAQGRVVGIPHMVVGRGAGLAVPSRVVERFLLAERGGRAFFGVAGEWVRVPSRAVEQWELPSAVGILLEEVVPSSPADEAGLLLGDVLVGLTQNGNGAVASGDLQTELRLATAGVAARLAILRGGELRSFEVTPRAAEGA